VQYNSFISRFYDTLNALFLTLLALACLAPIVHTLAISFSAKSPAEAGMVFFWPIDFNTASYQQILKDGQFWRSFAISLERVVLGSALNFVMTVMLAYPLSKTTKQFPIRNAIMLFIMFNMLFTPSMIPMYFTIKDLNLMNTMGALVLPSAVPIFSVLLVMNYFRNMPKELEEAGVMDGAGPWYLLLKVFVPLAVPTMATVTLFSIVGHWNNFFDGLIYMNNIEKYPLQTYIQQLIVKIDPSQMSTDDLIRLSSVSAKTMNAAKIFIAMLPILLLYPFLQKYFIHGIMLGSVKE
jgi:putative aldouronate transport system permease protein